MSLMSQAAEREAQNDIAVTIVDCDVHPMFNVTLEELEERYAPAEWRGRLYPHGNEVSPGHAYYTTPDWANDLALRRDAVPPEGGLPCSDPDFAARQLLHDAGVSIGVLSNLRYASLLGEVDHAQTVTTNNWLADVWLDKGNEHGRWRGSINVSNMLPEAGAREIERWAGHPYMAQVVMPPWITKQFGDPHYDPIYEAASRNDLPVMSHLMGFGPYETTPITPVGNNGHFHDHVAAAIPLLYASHVMSLVFDGAFERFPSLRFLIAEAAFTWVLPLMWRMDAVWEARRADLPWVKRRPSEYIREHLRLSTQPLEDPEGIGQYQQYLRWMESDKLLMFSSDYPHWSYDDPSFAVKHYPSEARDRIMYENAVDFYRLPMTVAALPVRITQC
jgi:uncharacterized protein